MIGRYIREQRKRAGLTQAELADKAGVGLRLIRDLEQLEKKSFRTDAVDKVLHLFGTKLGPIPLAEEDR